MNVHTPVPVSHPSTPSHLATDTLRVPRDMIYELAMNLGTPLEIGRRHGYSDAESMKLFSYPWLVKAIETAKIELEAAGFTFERKMAMLAEDLMVDCYHHAKDPQVNITTKLDVAKQLAKLGKLEPQNTNSNGPGAGGFAITINFKGAPPVTLDADAQMINCVDHLPTLDRLPEGWSADANADLIELPPDGEPDA